MDNMTTLCYIENNNRYLLLHRTKEENDINMDKWLGIGGHFEDGESPEECLLREVKEETNLTLNSYRFRGVVTFVCGDFVEYMCLYTSDDFEGEMSDCDEGELEWVEKSRMNELNFWEGDYIFLKLIEDNCEFFSLKLVYEEDKLIEANLNGSKIIV